MLSNDDRSIAMLHSVKMSAASFDLRQRSVSWLVIQSVHTYQNRA
jgi:hypothetical protein